VIDTPIVDRMKLLSTDKKTALASVPVKLYPVEKCAQAILSGVERNRRIIVITPFARIGWVLTRLFPEWSARMVRAAAAKSPVLGKAKDTLKPPMNADEH
jgi:short-subunit dehydrogenase